MKTIGIICEYNPFHNGHMYQINRIREEFSEDSVIIAVMSGDYVQRGEPAVFSKYARAEAACSCGADAVIELPLPWCSASAEKFAECAISILNGLNADCLSFGCEDLNPDEFREIAEFLASVEAVAHIKRILKGDRSLTYADAVQTVINERFPKFAGFLMQPNNLLSIEYLKALKTSGSKMEVFPVKRTGPRHDSEIAVGDICSASSIRDMLKHGKDISRFVPSEALKVYERELLEGRFVCGSLDNAQISRLRLYDSNYFSSLPDGENGAGMRLYRAVRNGGSIEDILSAAKTKSYTLARMRRVLLYAVLGTEKRDFHNSPAFARVLALNGSGLKWMSGLNSTIPIISRPAAIKRIGADAAAQFEFCSYAHDFYELGYESGINSSCGNDWKKQPFIKKA